MKTVNLPRVAVSIRKAIDQAVLEQAGAQLDLTENRDRKENWRDRILGWRQDSGIERAGLPNGVPFYVELFDFQIQRRPRNSEFGGGSIWPSDNSVAFGKSRFDEFLLIVVEGLRERVF